ncbi:glutathione S-transferase family protein [Plastoroseomonas hellenica]|uniref:glutathione S-transferase family protein n=1 Tax=Plastoroseomonas hellenica TaxID=2687306 RepID=UPI001BA8C643|nr:glutathione S-transferase [Plastoroseomonas hellenica]
MKLLYLVSSPYARKVLVLAHEAGLADRLEVIPAETSPIRSAPAVNTANPLGKVPVLLRDGAPALYDSVVICEYLDGLHAGRGLFPEAGEARWRSLRLHALADGLCDAAIAVRREDNRPSALHWPEWRLAHLRKLAQTYDLLEGEVAAFGDAVEIGQIALATALGWIEFRRAGPDFREAHPRLADWYQAFSRRPSMLATPVSDP